MNQAQPIVNLAPWWDPACPHLAWGHVWAVMLHPQDEQSRKNYLQSKMLEALATGDDAYRERFRDWFLDTFYCDEGLHWLWTKPSLQDIESEHQKLAERGMIAGWVLQYVFRVEMTFRAEKRPQRERGSVNIGMHFVERRLENSQTLKGSKPTSNREFIRQAWSHFKSASPLWAAFVTRWHQFPSFEGLRDAHQEGALETHLFTELPEFLTLAKFFRAFGTRLLPHAQRGVSLLDPPQTWDICGVPLPTGKQKLKVPPLLPEEQNELRQYTAS